MHTESFASERVLSSFLDDVAQHVCDIGGYDFSCVMVSDPDASRLLIRGRSHFSDEFVSNWNASNWLLLHEEANEAASVRAFLEHRTIMVPDILENRPIARPWIPGARTEEYRALLATPLLSSSGSVGVLCVAQREPREFAPHEFAFLESVAALATLAVESRKTAEAVAESLESFQQASVLHEHLIQVSDLDGILDLLAGELQTWACLIDAQGRPWPRLELKHPAKPRVDGPPASELAEIRQALHSVSWTPGHVATFGGQGEPLAAAVRVVDPVNGTGFLALGSTASLAMQTVVLDLQDAALMVRRVLDENRRLRAMRIERNNELVESLIHGFFSPTEQQVARAEEFGFDFTQEHAAVLIEGGAADAGSHQERQWQDTLERWSSEEGTLVLQGHRARLSAVVITTRSGRDADPVDRWWTKAHKAFSGVRFRVAAGAYGGAERLGRSYEEAQRAMRVLVALGASDTALWYPSVGLLGVLASAADSADFLTFSQSVVAPLRAYDHRTSGHLEGTLRDYFRLGQNVRRTAETQFVHPNSVYHRLRKVAELTGLHVDRPTERLQLELALLLSNLERAAPSR